MSDLLPIGTLVQVTPRPFSNDTPYRAIVRGHDVFGTKYELGREYLHGYFAAGGWWAFPSEVAEITKES